MKKHIHQAFMLVMLVMSLTACNKNSDAVKPSLDSSKASLLKQTIEDATDFTVANIENVEEHVCDKGNFEIINFLDEKGVKRNFVQSDFLFEVKSDNVHFSDNQKNGEVNTRFIKSYKLWCTAAGNCTTCQVSLTESGGNSPVASCTCSECHLHVQITD